MKTKLYFLTLLFSILTINTFAQTETSGNSVQEMQISFVPYFGTGGPASDKNTYRVSFNIIGGAVYGVTNCEIGGLINIDKNDVGYCQLAGVANIVNGNVSGFQAAGNINVAKSMNGVQIAGTLNSVAEAHGLQIAGLVNHASQGDVSQISGLVNNTGGSGKYQVAGLINQSAETSEMQLAGLVNNTRKTNIQLAGLVNNSPVADQFQIAGLVNNTRNTVFQVSGLVNNAASINSMQVSGLINHAKNVNGTQISGLLNTARKINGVQIGVINIADTCNGLSIGVLNFARNGYHTLELSADEFIYSNIAFRSGMSYFHTILIAGIRPDAIAKPLWTYGAGVGGLIPLSQNNRIGLDVTFSNVIKENYVDNNYLFKGGLGFDRKLGRNTAIYLGITYNFLMVDKTQKHYSTSYENLAPYHLEEWNHGHFSTTSWVGGKVAFRFF